MPSPTSSSGAYYHWKRKPVKMISEGELHLYREAKRLFHQTRSGIGYVKLTQALQHSGFTIGETKTRLRGGNNRSNRYDGLDRLTRSSGPWGGSSVNYDSIDNINSKTMGTNAYTYSYSGNKVSRVRGLKNFVQDALIRYDGRGNIIEKANASHGWTYTFDGADHLRTVRTKVGNTLLRSFDYAGNGNRVRTVKPGDTRVYIHSQSGQLLSEFVTAGSKLNIFNIYLGSMLVAEVEKGGGPLPPTDIFGWGYGNSENKIAYSRTFNVEKLSHPVRVCVDGYGINSATEVSITVNGVVVGYLSPGGDPTTTCIDVPIERLRLGNNTVVFTQAVIGNTWGVTILSIRSKNTVVAPFIMLLLDEED